MPKGPLQQGPQQRTTCQQRRVTGPRVPRGKTPTKDERPGPTASTSDTAGQWGQSQPRTEVTWHDAGAFFRCTRWCRSQSSVLASGRDRPDVMSPEAEEACDRSQTPCMVQSPSGRGREGTSLAESVCKSYTHRTLNGDGQDTWSKRWQTRRVRPRSRLCHTGSLSSEGMKPGRGNQPQGSC